MCLTVDCKGIRRCGGVHLCGSPPESAGIQGESHGMLPQQKQDYPDGSGSHGQPPGYAGGP